MLPLIALMVAGAVAKGIGAIKSGNAAKAAATANADREEYNAKIADVQAAEAISEGASEESRYRSQVRQLIGQQRVGFAAQNVDVGFGSAAQVQGDSAFLGELDAQAIRFNAARKAWGLELEATDRRLAADVYRKGGQAAQTAGYFGAASTGLDAGTSLLRMKYRI